MRATAHLGAACIAALVVAGCARDDDRSNARIALDAAVRVEAEGCGDHLLVGGGAFVAPGLVVTVAHVVAGSTDVDLVLADGSEQQARVVAIDRRADLAVLGSGADVVPLARGSMRAGTRGDLVVWRDGRPVTEPFSATRFVHINASDIDHGPPNPREGFEVRATIEPGDSGSVLVADGAAVAVVFGRSTVHADRAWATDIAEASGLLDAVADPATAPAVDTGPCT